jgi:hypothetical protein
MFTMCKYNKNIVTMCAIQTLFYQREILLKGKRGKGERVKRWLLKVKRGKVEKMAFKGERVKR